MHGHALLRGNVVDRLQYEAVIFLILGATEDIVTQIIAFYLLLSLCKDEVFVQI
jgi:hypothetical protein